MQARKIVILGTGGTIAGVSPQGRGDSSDYIAGQRPVADLLAGLQPPAGCEVLSEQVAQIDSKDMDETVWRLLLQRCRYWLAQEDVQGLVITHGTDTLEETAYLLQAVLAPPKPVVLTCAMRPATAIDADGPQNLLDAMVVGAQPGACGVVAVCAARIHGAFDVQKAHSWQLDAFDAGDAGPIGRVYLGRVHPSRPWPALPQAPMSDVLFERLMSDVPWPRVEVVVSHGGASGALLDALLDASRASGGEVPPLRGLIVVATGAGTVHRALEPALTRARQAGVRVVRASRCARGGIQAREDDLWAGAGELSLVKARLALMLELLAQ